MSLTRREFANGSLAAKGFPAVRELFRSEFSRRGGVVSGANEVGR